MGTIFVSVISLIVTAFTFLILVYVILSYILSPYHPIREMVGRVVDPLLNPIRRAIPSAGGFDFSPLILWLAVELIGQILIRLVRAF